MARALTEQQRALLRSPDLQINALATFYLDEGTYRFCDDSFDLTDGTNTFVGANALTDSVEIRSAANLAAEPVTLIIDGNRMAQYGIQDPARVLRDILGYLYQQRRVDLAFGFRYSYSQEINLVIPTYGGKINYARIVDSDAGDGLSVSEAVSGSSVAAKLEIVLDSLAARYSRATFRTRSHQDQLELDPTDNFYSFTIDASIQAQTLYWGKDAPINQGVSSTRPPQGLAGIRLY